MNQVQLCPECHHRPSERMADCGDYHAECYCQCHDVADAAPQLLTACRAMYQLFEDDDAGVKYSFEHLADEKEANVKAALALCLAAIVNATPAEPQPTPDKPAQPQDAVERAKEMLTIPIKDLPFLARHFANDLCSQVGMCTETVITAYACYAQAVEGLPCKDPAYQIRADHAQWFRDTIAEGRRLGLLS